MHALDRWNDPILLKELRATFRGWKFLAVHTGFLGLMAVALVVVILALSDEARAQPALVGRGVHQIFIAGMGLAVVFVLPAFASTTIVAEREGDTFELLQTTTLTPTAVIRGKFLAAMVYSTVFLFSSLPVGAIAFLFGGVTVTNLLASYAALFTVSAIANAFSIFISAHAKTSRTALGGTAGFGMLLAVGLVGFASLPYPPGGAAVIGRILGIEALVDLFPRALPLAPLDAFLHLLVLPVYILASVFAFSAIAAVNRIKTRAGNRSTNLKVFFLLFNAGGLALWSVLLFRTSFGAPWEKWRAAIMLFGALAVVSVLSSFFAAEDPQARLPVRLRTRRRFSPMRLFNPGSDNGVFYNLAVNLLVLPAAAVTLSVFMDGPEYRIPLVALAATTFAFLFFSSAAGYFLSTVVVTERLRMVLQSTLVVAFVFLPLIAFASLHRFKKILFLSPFDPGLASPIVAFGSLTSGYYDQAGLKAERLSSTPLTEFPFEAALGGWSFPAYLSSVALFAVLGVLLALWGRARMRRIEGAAKDARP